MVRWGVCQVRMRNWQIVEARYLLGDGTWAKGPTVFVDLAPRLFLTEAEAEAVADEVRPVRGFLAVPVELQVDASGRVLPPGP